MTHRVYKDEYSDAQIQFFRKSFCVVDESPKVLSISGEESDLDKVMSCMHTGEAEFKAVFPDFLTTEDRKNNTMALAKDCFTVIQDTLLKMIDKGLITDPLFDVLHAAERAMMKQIYVGAE